MFAHRINIARLLILVSGCGVGCGSAPGASWTVDTVAPLDAGPSAHPAMMSSPGEDSGAEASIESDAGPLADDVGTPTPEAGPDSTPQAADAGSTLPDAGADVAVEDAPVADVVVVVDAAPMPTVDASPVAPDADNRGPMSCDLGGNGGVIYCVGGSEFGLVGIDGVYRPCGLFLQNHCPSAVRCQSPPPANFRGRCL